MASIIESVEYVECVWDNTDDGSVNLSKGQDWQKCVPFFSWFQDTGGVPNDFRERCFAVDIYNNAGTGAVRILRGGAVDVDNRLVGVFVVEFVAAINVQKEAFDMLDTDFTDNNSITDVTDQDSAFMLMTYDYTDTAAQQGPANTALGVQFTGASTTSITIVRQNNNGTCIGWVYIVDCDSGEFIVDHQTIAVGATDLESTTTISATVLADTFLVTDFQTDENGDNPDEAAFIMDLEDTTTIRARRTISGATPADAATIYVQVVECQNTEWNVQRGEEIMNATPEVATITAVTQANSIVKNGCHNAGIYDLGASDLTGGINVENLSVVVNFNSSTEIAFTRDNDVETGNIIPWEVIDFTGITNPVIITDVNTTETWNDGDTGLVITGTGFV